MNFELRVKGRGRETRVLLSCDIIGRIGPWLFLELRPKRRSYYLSELKGKGQRKGKPSSAIVRDGMSTADESLDLTSLTPFN